MNSWNSLLRGNQGTQACGSCISAAAFIVAARLVSALWRIESD